MTYSLRLKQGAILSLWNVALFASAAGCQPSHPDPAIAATPQIPDPFAIHLTGTDHRWQAVYPAIGTAGPVVQELHAGSQLRVPVNTEIILVLTSSDYIYTLAVPELGVKEIAVPGMEFRIMLRMTDLGQYSLINDELCGLPASGNVARLVVEPRENFQRQFTGNDDQH